MNDSRRAQVLRAIVEDFVATNEPVGSKAIVQRHTLGVSPATIRNDMAQLEAEGYIAQPHTSAGRIPTDLGYRMFVDRIDEFKPLSQAERRAILQLVDGESDLDGMLDRTVRLLAGLTHQVALIQYPMVSQAKVKHIEVVGLAAGRVLVVLITDAARSSRRSSSSPRRSTRTVSPASASGSTPSTRAAGSRASTPGHRSSRRTPRRPPAHQRAPRRPVRTPLTVCPQRRRSHGSATP